MTVKELKEKLSAYSDDMELGIIREFRSEYSEESTYEFDTNFDLIVNTDYLLLNTHNENQLIID